MINRKTMLFGTGAICVATLLGVVAVLGKGALGDLQTMSKATFIKQMKSCLTERESVVTCAPHIVGAFMQSHSSFETMQVLSDALSTRDCHVVGHTVGQLAYKKEGSVDKALSRCGSSRLCGAACTHGAIGQAFVEETGLSENAGMDLKHLGVDDIERFGTDLCKSIDTCHGVGHILFQIYNDIDASIASCKNIVTGTKLQSCFTGVFMENADLISTHNLLLGTRKNQARDPSDLLYPCNTAHADARHACFRYLPRVQMQTFDEQGEFDERVRTKARIDACLSLSSVRDRTDCVEGIGFSAYTHIKDDPKLGHALCDSFPTSLDRAACMQGMVFWAANFGQTDEILSFCEVVENESERSVCYHGLFETLTADKETPEQIRSHCARHNEERCLAGYTAYRANPRPQLLGIPIPL